LALSTKRTENANIRARKKRIVLAEVTSRGSAIGGTASIAWAGVVVLGY
jgi:hypothetical protein